MNTLRAFLFPNTTVMQSVGISGILFLALCMWISTAGANFGLFLVLIATISQLTTPEFRLMIRDPVTKLVIIMIAYILAWDLALGMIGKDIGKYSATKEWMYILIPWCSYWIYKYPRLIIPILILAATGKLIESAATVPQNWNAFQNAWNGGHVFKAKGHGFYFSSVLLGLIILFPRFRNWLSQYRLPRLGIAIYAAIILWFLQCLLSAQTRIAWLFFITVLTFVFIIAIRHYYHQQKITKQTIVKITLGISFATVTFIGLQYSQIKTNFLRDDATNIQKILQGDSDLTYTSATHRYLLYRYATNLWLQSPILGHGPIDSSYYVDNHEDKALHVDGHFHSSYLEILVSFGLLGFMLFAVLSYMLLSRFYKSYQQGKIAPDLALFIASVFLLAGLWNLFNSRFIHVDWRFFWILLIGITHASALRAQKNS